MILRFIRQPFFHWAQCILRIFLLLRKNEDQSMKIIKQSLENIENEKNFNQKLLDNKQKFDDELTKNIKNYESKVE